MQQGEQIIYCCGPCVFALQDPKPHSTARTVKICEYLRCVGPVNMGISESKEYNSILKYFVVVSDITAAMANSHCLLKREKNQTPEKERIPALERLSSVLKGPLEVWMW